MEIETRDEETVEDSFEAIGAELASARLDNGIQLAELAQLLRISRNYLKDLEAGNHSNLPGPTYVSGYIRSVAREVGLDGEAMSQRYRALLDTKPVTPTYRFPIDNQQPQRSGAMVASVLVIFAVAGYGGWYVAGKPDLTAGLFSASEPEVTAAAPQVEITATEPDNLISGDSDPQTVASVEDTLAAPDAAIDTDDADATADLAAVQPADAPLQQTDTGLVEDTAPTVLAAVDGASGDVAAVDASSVDAPAALQPEATAPQTDLAAGTEAPSAVLADDPATGDATRAATNLAASSENAGLAEPGQQSGGGDQLARADTNENALSGGGVAFARQRLPELEITVRATGISWVEIIRNDGEEVMTKLMREGEIYVVDSRDKLYLSTGNAGGLELLFHDGSVRPVGESGEILRDLPLDADRLRNQL